MRGKRRPPRRTKAARYKDVRVQPHRSTNLAGQPGVCRRCDHSWPCPSATAGVDLPEHVPCGAHPGSVPDDAMQDTVALVALGLVRDTGRRRPGGGRPRIVWDVNPRIVPFMGEIEADLALHVESPDEEDIRTVLRWLAEQPPVAATRSEVAVMCGAELDMPASDVARCLLWAQVFGFVDGPV